MATKIRRYQDGIGQGRGSSFVPNSGQTKTDPSIQTPNLDPQLVTKPLTSTQGITGFQKPLAPATTIVGNYMPYTDAVDPRLPDYVKALPDLKKRQWVAVWNSAYKRCRDKGGADECESAAFAQSNGVVKVKSNEEPEMSKDLVNDEIALLLDWAQDNPRDALQLISTLELKERTLTDDDGGTGPVQKEAVEPSEEDEECPCAACKQFDPKSDLLHNPSDLGAYFKAKLSAAQRDDMPKSQFAYTDPSGKGHFPINDETHVRNALAVINGAHGNPGPYASKAKAKVCSAAKRMGVDAESCGDSGSKSFKSFIKELFTGSQCCAPQGGAGQGAVQGDPLVSVLFKDKFGRLRVYLRASNNFRDLHSEIITEAAHKEYESFIDRTGVKPKLWIWHVKGTRWGEVDLVTYADNYLHVFGTVDPGCEDLAYNIVKSKAAVSHGFITFGLDVANKSITQYRTWEFSVLPSGSEANPWGTKVGFVNLKEELAMAIPQAKRLWMQELGIPSEMIKAIEDDSQQTGQFVKDLGVDSKQREREDLEPSLYEALGLTTKAVDKPKADAARKRPAQLKTAVGKDDNDDDTEPDGDEDDAPTRTNSKELVTVLKAFMAKFDDIDAQLKELKQTKDEDYLGQLRGAAPSQSESTAITKDRGDAIDRLTDNSEKNPNAWFSDIVAQVNGGR